jgi:hypothetical protein
MTQRVFVHGYPGLYGGAQTELHHQIPVWQGLGLEVNLIPSQAVARTDRFAQDLLASGVKIHDVNQFEVIDKHAPVFGFCSRSFLGSIDIIRRYSENTAFVNCMTWLFEEEKRRQAEGKIKTFLYQNDDVRQIQAPVLRALNPSAPAKFLTFVPYFDSGKFPFIDKRTEDYFGCGRISRQDQDKYSAKTLHIYEYFVAPKPKAGMFLGFDERSARKVGVPAPWILTARDQRQITQQEFYEHCEIVLQPTDTVENWPRVGLEAMASGSVLIVDNRGGWTRMIEHGKTGWLCNSTQDFIFYASKMAYEPEMRREMAHQARVRGQGLSGLGASIASWKSVFEAMI